MPEPVLQFSEPPFRRRIIFFAGCLLLAGLTVVIYAQMWDHQFINYDDGTYVSENPHVRTGLTWDNLMWAFSRDSAQGSANWHPLTWWSLMLDAQIYGTFAGGFRMTNLALHIANALLLLWILKTMTGHAMASWFVATVFAVHPLHVESVAWIAERKDVLSLFFGLLSVCCHLRYVRTAARSAYVFGLIAFAFSLMSKQMLVTLPCVLLLLDYWPLRRTFGGAATWLVLLREKWGYLLLTVVFCGIAVFSQTDGRAVGSLEQFPMAQRLLNAACVYVIYLWQTIFPRRLAVFYPYPEHSLWIPAMCSAVVLFAMSVGVYRGRQRSPWLVTGWLWFLGSLVPVIGIVQIGTQRMADRYMYFPMIGLLIAVTWQAAAAARRWPSLQKPMAAAAVAAIAACTALSWRQVGYWQSTSTLFSHAVEAAESSLSWNKLGYEFALQGDVTRASNCFHRALRLDPEYTFAHVSLGNVYLAEQRFPEAEQHFRAAVEISPTYDEAQYNLGIALLSQGRAQDAIPHFERAIELTPDDPQAYVNLGIALTMAGDNDLAIQKLQYGLQLNPASPEAHFNLAKIYADQGATTAAIQHLNQVVTQTGTNIPESQQAEAFLQLQELYSRLGQTAAADHAGRQAERLLNLETGMGAGIDKGISR